MTNTGIASLLSAGDYGHEFNEDILAAYTLELTENVYCFVRTVLQGDIAGSLY